MTDKNVAQASEKDRETREEEFRCPQCRHAIPEKAYRALMKKVARGEHAECDYCPY